MVPVARPPFRTISASISLLNCSARRISPCQTTKPSLEMDASRRMSNARASPFSASRSACHSQLISSRDLMALSGQNVFRGISFNPCAESWLARPNGKSEGTSQASTPKWDEINSMAR